MYIYIYNKHIYNIYVNEVYKIMMTNVVLPHGSMATHMTFKPLSIVCLLICNGTIFRPEHLTIARYVKVKHNHNLSVIEISYNYSNITYEEHETFSVDCFECFSVRIWLISSRLKIFSKMDRYSLILQKSPCKNKPPLLNTS